MVEPAPHPSVSVYVQWQLVVPCASSTVCRADSFMPSQLAAEFTLKALHLPCVRVSQFVYPVGLKGSWTVACPAGCNGECHCGCCRVPKGADLPRRGTAGPQEVCAGLQQTHRTLWSSRPLIRARADNRIELTWPKPAKTDPHHTVLALGHTNQE